MAREGRFDVESGRLINLAGNRGRKGIATGGSKFRTRVNQEADPKLQPEDAHAAPVARRVCGPPIHHHGSRSSRLATL